MMTERMSVNNADILAKFNHPPDSNKLLITIVSRSKSIRLSI